MKRTELVALPDDAVQLDEFRRLAERATLPGVSDDEKAAYVAAASPEAIEGLFDRLEHAEAVIARASEHHQPDEDGDCEVDGFPYPCHTARILNGEWV